MRNKKGFTLVELVIVIAVIAILAGVMIAVFSGVVNDARESADLQKTKNEELAMKTDDVLKKLDDADWFGWEDLEKKIAEEITKNLANVTVGGTSTIDVNAIVAQIKSGVTLDAAQITELKNALTVNVDTTALQAATTKAIQDAFKEYAQSAAGDHTALTEEQVRTIVKGCLDDSYTGVTEEQMKAIITEATSGLVTKEDLIAAGVGAGDLTGLESIISENTISKRDVQTIIDTAIANKLNTAQASVWVSQIKNQIAGIADNVTALQDSIDQVKGGALTEEQVLAILESSIPVTKTATSAEEVAAYAASLIDGSTIVVKGSLTTVEIKNVCGDVPKSITLKGAKITTLNVDDAKLTLYVYNDVENLDVDAVDMHSLHVFGTVEKVKVAVGHIVFEDTAKVESVTVNATGVVALNVAKKAEVSNGITINTVAADAGVKVYTEATKAVEVTVAETVTADTAKKQVAVLVSEDATATVTAAGDAVTAEAIVNAITYEGASASDAEKAQELSQKVADIIRTKAEKVINIKTAADLQAFADVVNGFYAVEAQNFEGFTVNLKANIALTSGWTPIGIGARDVGATKAARSIYGATFAGTFNGNGYTISGLTAAGIESWKAQYTDAILAGSTQNKVVYGLFGILEKATIKNLTVTADIDLTTSATVGDSVGAVVGYICGDVTLEGITVNGTVKGIDAIGGIVGRNYDPDKIGYTTTLKNCTNNAFVKAENLTNTSEGKGGQFVGYASHTVTIVLDHCNANGTCERTYTGAMNDVNGYYCVATSVTVTPIND